MDPEIADFWSWFSDNRTMLASDRVPQDCVDVINRKIKALRIPAWELGPDPKSPGGFYLCLSAANSKESARRVHEVLSASPATPDWRFTPYRQKKDWPGFFYIRRGAERFTIDCRLWKFSFSEVDEGIILDICMPPDSIPLGSNIREMSSIFVLNEIGEEDFERMFFDYDVDCSKSCLIDERFMGYFDFSKYWKSVVEAE